MITLNSDAASTSLSKTTKAILNEYGIKLNKNLGQNYLIDRNKRDQIIQFGNLTKDDVVLEIGPGIGTLTIELAKRVKKVIAIEQDSNICQILENRLKKENIDNKINELDKKNSTKSSQIYLIKFHHQLHLNS